MPREKLSENREKEILLSYQGGTSVRRIRKDFFVGEETVKQVLAKNFQPVRNHYQSQATRVTKYNFNRRFFSEINSEEKAYWLGFIAADGGIRDSKDSFGLAISLAEKDGEHLMRFLQSIDSDHPIHLRKGGPGDCKGKDFIRQDQRWVFIGSKQLAQDLSLHGITPRKTYTLSWPVIPEENYRHYLRGYFDGDGFWGVSLKDGGKRTVIKFSVTSSLPFLYGAQDYLVNKLNLARNKITEVGKSGKIGCLEYSAKQQCLCIAKLLYDDATIFLPRKFEKIRPFLEEHSNESIYS